MKWRGLTVVLLGLSNMDVASLAQGPPDGQRPPTVSASPLADGCFSSAGVVRFRMIGGRISLDPPLHRKGSESREVGGIFESVNVTAERGIPSLHYVSHSPRQQLTLSVRNATELRLESWIPESGRRSVLEQPEFATIRWTLTESGTEETFLGSSLLHLREQSPEQFDGHYDAILTCVLRGCSLRSFSEATREVLLDRLATVETPDRATIIEAVEALDSPKRRDRMLAERSLLSWGTPILPVLATIDPDRLGAEPKSRLAQIRRQLRRYRDDTPTSLAMQLINDRDYWGWIAPQMNAAEISRVNTFLTQRGIGAVEEVPSHTRRIASAPQ